MMLKLLAQKTAIPRQKLRLAAALCLVGLLSKEAMPTTTDVQVELVLALDVSASVNLDEYHLQLQGIAQAFNDPEILEAIEQLGPQGAAISVTQWGGPAEFQTIVPFTHIASAQDGKAFGFLVSRGHRYFGATNTSIAAAMLKSAALIDNNMFDGAYRVIDVSGDGEDNSGLDLEAARTELATKRFVVNGLAIEQDEVRLTQYFKDYVIIGNGAFVETANDYDDFARAIKAKLLRELKPDLS